MWIIVAPEQGRAQQAGAGSKCPPSNQLLRGRRSYAKEYENGAIQPRHVLICKTPDFSHQLHSEHRRNLIDHQPTRRTEPISSIRFDFDTKQWRPCRISREGANSYGIRVIETIILNDHDRTRLARIVRAARNRPNLAPSHSAFQAEIESTKS
jgi:hypothetical protein